MKRDAFPILLVLMLFSLCLSRSAAGSENRLSEESASCLSCHAKPGIQVVFDNNESIEAYINADAFRKSVHNSLSCSGCHSDFASGRHPERKFRNKLHYQTKASLACRHCHRNPEIKKSGIHVALLEQEKKGVPILCTNCHGSHEIRGVTRTAKYTNEEAYCMKCHSGRSTMRFRNGETVSVTIDRLKLLNSVHNKLSCSDCHYGFSSEEHPNRNFATRRDYTLASSDNCRRCHFDKYTKTMESIHYTMLSQGNTSAPVCIDCHGSHGISRTGKERASIAKRCQRCHPEIYEIYAKSVHGSALFNENNQDVPVCADCHTAHTMEDPRKLNYRERIPEMCSNCHANVSVVGKYGLSTGVVDTYLADFHGVTLKFYKLQKDALNRPAKAMAVCTDCHGSHNITTTIGPRSSIVKANLEKRCRKCHAGAPKNFPDTWLSHYEPNFKRAPLVYVVTVIYRIFIPVLVVGLVLQILLHIWRYVVNR